MNTLRRRTPHRVLVEQLRRPLVRRLELIEHRAHPVGEELDDRDLQAGEAREHAVTDHRREKSAICQRGVASADGRSRTAAGSSRPPRGCRRAREDPRDSDGSPPDGGRRRCPSPASTSQNGSNSGSAIERRPPNPLTGAGRCRRSRAPRSATHSNSSIALSRIPEGDRRCGEDRVLVAERPVLVHPLVQRMEHNVDGAAGRRASPARSRWRASATSAPGRCRTPASACSEARRRRTRRAR